MARSPESPNTPKLSELEWEVMKPFWEKGPMAARDVFALVGEQNQWTYKTLKTMLARLVQKGALAYEQVGNSYLYRAAHDRSVMTQTATGTFVQRVFDGALTPFLAFFAERATPEELAVIRQELAKLEDRSSSQDKRPDKGRGRDDHDD